MDLIKVHPPFEEEKKKALSHRQFLVRYTISGASSVVIQFAALTSMVEFLALDPTLSSGIAYLIGCFVNYQMLYFWTFRSKASHVSALLKYFLVTSCTLLVNLGLFWIMVELFHLWYLFSQVFATILVAALNMIIFKLYTFAETKHSNESVSTESQDKR